MIMLYLLLTFPFAPGRALPYLMRDMTVHALNPLPLNMLSCDWGKQEADMH
jgi:hypothetical protein